MKCVNDGNKAEYYWKGNSVCEDCIGRIRQRILDERKTMMNWWV